MLRFSAQVMQVMVAECWVPLALHQCPLNPLALAALALVVVLNIFMYILLTNVTVNVLRDVL